MKARKSTPLGTPGWMRSLCLAGAVAANAAPDSQTQVGGDIVLVDKGQISKKEIARWKGAGFGAVAVVLDERFQRSDYQACERVKGAGLGLFYWMEIARSPRLADAHPEWMASLGMHDDWRKQFPGAKVPREGEVVKAFPWVPIRYREAFEAHLTRVDRLLQLVPPGFQGLLLNDLQGAPASCGCGNLQCRWATDYHVPATASPQDPDEAAARFVAAVRERSGGKTVIPVWATECDDEDLPAAERAGEWTTGYSGTVGCAVGRCPKDFTRQWSALARSHSGPIAVLALHREFGRVFPQYGDATAWVRRSIDYLDRTLPRHGGELFSRDRLWAVVQGYRVSRDEETSARRAAARAGATVTIVARTRIDQSYDPRIVRAAVRP